MRASRLGLALVTLALPSACLLTTNLDGLTGAASDAAPDVAMPAPTDGGDGGLLVMPLPTEAGLDGSNLQGDAGCPQKPIALCENFASDEKANGWEVVRFAGGDVGTTMLDSGRPILYATTPAVNAGDGPAAYWQKAFTPIVSKLSFDADFGYDNRTTHDQEYHLLFQVRVDHGSTWNLIYLGVYQSNNGFVLQDFPTSGAIDFQIIDVTPNTVHHVHFDVAVGGRSRLAIDGVTLKDFATDGFFQAGTATISAGITASTVPSTPISFGMGSLVFTAE